MAFWFSSSVARLSLAWASCAVAGRVASHLRASTDDLAQVVKDQRERLDKASRGFDLAAGKLATLSQSAFISQLEPCVVEKSAGTEPQILPPGVAGLAAILVVHGMKLTSRAEKLRSLLAEQGLQNWSFIEAYDGDAIDPEALECFFGDWVESIGGDTCCNRESSTLKPHLALLSLVKLNLTGALLLEDDLVVVPSTESSHARLERAAAMLRGCDLVRVAPYAVGYMVSNAGARKLLHYSLRRGGKRISNPMDLQMDEVIDQGYDGGIATGRRPSRIGATARTEAATSGL